MGTLGEVARITRPAGCTCDYPRVVASDGNGHARSCPAFQEWVADLMVKAAAEPPATIPVERLIALRREEVPGDGPRRDDPPPRREEQPDDSCLGRMPRKQAGDPRRRHEADPRGRHGEDGRRQGPR